MTGDVLKGAVVEAPGSGFGSGDPSDPFAASRSGELFGVLVLPRPPLAPRGGPGAGDDGADRIAWLEAPVARPEYGAESLGDLRARLAGFFGADPSSPAGFDLAFVARFWSVLDVLSSPWSYRARGAEALSHLDSVFTPVPGHALDTLLWATWRYCQLAARELLDLADAMDAGDGTRVGQVEASLDVGDQVPAYDLGCWGGDPSAPPRLERRVRYAWGSLGLKPAVLGAVRQLYQARAVAGVPGAASPAKENRTRARMKRPGRPIDSSQGYWMRAANFRTYQWASTRVLGAVVIVLRVVLHVRWCAANEGPGSAASWRRLVDPLEPLLDTGASDLEAFFFDARAVGDIPWAWLRASQERFRTWLVMHGSGALLRVWGVEPGEPDGPRRWGRIGPVPEGR